MAHPDGQERGAARQPVSYEIRLQGHLGPEWSEWFGGMRVILLDQGDTILTGPVVDQAALHGLLARVRDLGIPLVSVRRLGAEPTDQL